MPYRSAFEGTLYTRFRYSQDQYGDGIRIQRGRCPDFVRNLTMPACSFIITGTGKPIDCRSHFPASYAFLLIMDLCNHDVAMRNESSSTKQRIFYCYTKKIEDDHYSTRGSSVAMCRAIRSNTIMTSIAAIFHLSQIIHMCYLISEKIQDSHIHKPFLHSPKLHHFSHHNR